MMNHSLDLDILNQFMGRVHSRVPPKLVGPFLERLNETHCPVSFDTIPHLMVATSGIWTLLTVDTKNGCYIRSLPNDFVGVVQW